MFQVLSFLWVSLVCGFQHGFHLFFWLFPVFYTCNGHSCMVHTDTVLYGFLFVPWGCWYHGIYHSLPSFSPWENCTWWWLQFKGPPMAIAFNIWHAGDAWWEEETFIHHWCWPLTSNIWLVTSYGLTRDIYNPLISLNSRIQVEDTFPCAWWCQEKRPLFHPPLSSLSSW